MTSPRSPRPVEVIEVGAGRSAVEAVEVAAPGRLDGSTVVSIGDRAPADPVVFGYTHAQDEPSDTWVVDHNLGRRPTAWSLFDAEGRLRGEYRVETPTVNRAVVRMDVATNGKLRLI